MREKILKSDRRGTGVNVVWEAGGDEREAFFSFEELIDLKVNALDLLNNPGNYAIDEGARKISYVAFCQPSWHHE